MHWSQVVEEFFANLRVLWVIVLSFLKRQHYDTKNTKKHEGIQVQGGDSGRARSGIGGAAKRRRQGR
jgi:hypothetical protein